MVSPFYSRNCFTQKNHEEIGNSGRAVSNNNYLNYNKPAMRDNIFRKNFKGTHRCKKGARSKCMSPFCLRGNKNID